MSWRGRVITIATSYVLMAERLKELIFGEVEVLYDCTILGRKSGADLCHNLQNACGTHM